MLTIMMRAWTFLTSIYRLQQKVWSQITLVSLFFRTQLCINTAIVYVHRFYMFHSFNKFHRNPISSCALFLAAKVEEQPRKLEHVIRVAHMILYKDQRNLDINSEVSNSHTNHCTFKRHIHSLFCLRYLPAIHWTSSRADKQWKYSSPDSWLWCRHWPPSHTSAQVLSASI